jgi:hypothetical protein
MKSVKARMILHSTVNELLIKNFILEIKNQRLDRMSVLNLFKTIKKSPDFSFFSIKKINVKYENCSYHFKMRYSPSTQIYFYEKIIFAPSFIFNIVS